ncbi:MAG: DUF2782 domain-containing protein [Xanthomonadaceae bacterium]|nr:DUF2782 domain-containing protein [Xanthomonadaceae bacterium]
MKIAALLAAASVLLASSAFAQSSVSSTNVPPPPGINDPGVKAVSPAKSGGGHDHAGTPKSSLPPLTLPPMKSGDTRLGRDASPPDVRVRQEGDINVQEYRRNGQVYMVVVTPKNGIQQIYTVDPQGRLVDEHGQKPVGPVMYKVLEWGKSRPPAQAAPADTQDGDGH